MIEEREYGGFTFPFVGGVALAIYCFSATSVCSRHLAPACAIVLASMVAAVFFPHAHGSFSPNAAFVAALGAVTGLFCGLSASELSVSTATGGLFPKAESFGEMMKHGIDAIPFEDSITNSLAKALLTGDRKELGAETTAIFRRSGASHILALSGFHLGIIYGGLRKILSILGGSRRATVGRFLTIICVCWFYVCATGAGASIVRAFLFILIGETADVTFRSRNLKDIIRTSLAVHLALSPSSVKSVGFQLSYAAMIGIAWLYPPLKNLWPEAIKGEKTGIIKKIWNTAALSISCQMTSGLAAWGYFGTFPQYFLLTNLLAVPVSALLIPSFLVVLMLDSLGLCPEFLIAGTESLCRLFLFILETISTM